jgi:hypothetical protein
MSEIPIERARRLREQAQLGCERLAEVIELLSHSQRAAARRRQAPRDSTHDKPEEPLAADSKGDWKR